MANELNNILIFKTNIQTEGDKQRIQALLEEHDAIQQSNLDLYDVDCVLRVISDSLTPREIITVITNNGFECAELE
jgi:uncharacterized Fe-S cluster-containing protein